MKKTNAVSRNAVFGALFLTFCACNHTTESSCVEWPATYPASQVIVQTNQAYAADGGLRVGDVYSPPGDGPFPVLIFAHGGGYFGGDKKNHADLATYYAQRGIVTIPINYFLAKQDGSDPAYPRSMQDVYCAVRAIRADASRLKIDKTRLGLMGGSAGGTTVNMIALGGANAPFNGGCSQNGESVTLQAAIDYFGASEFAGDPSSDPRSLTVFGVSPSQATLTEASPLTYVSSRAPPYFITHGTADATMPIAHSEKLYSALSAQGIDVTYKPVDGAPHGYADDWDGEYNLRIRCDLDAFLKRTLTR